MPEYHTVKGQSTVAKDNIFEDDRFLDLKETLKDGLLSFCTAAGLAALHVLMEEKVIQDYLPESAWPWVKQVINRAWAHQFHDFDKAHLVAGFDGGQG